MPNDQVILITGGSGFAGSHLVELLLSQHYSQVHVTTVGNHSPFIQQLLPPEHIHQLDLTQTEAVNQLISDLQPSHIYHLAAMAEVGHSFNTAEKILVNNTILQLNVLEAIRHHSAHSRVLIVGSGQEYDLIKDAQAGQTHPVAETQLLGPANPYALSKVTQDLMGLSYHYAYQLQVVRARPFNHTGERQSPLFAIPAFAEQIVKVERGQQTEISVGNLSGIRDFTDVKDVVKAYQLLMEKGTVGDVYNIGSGQGHSLQEVLNHLIQLSQTSISVVQDPHKIRPLDVPSVIADNAKIKALGWQPTIPLTDTLTRVLNYWRTQV